MPSRQRIEWMSVLPASFSYLSANSLINETPGPCYSFLECITLSSMACIYLTATSFDNHDFGSKSNANIASGPPTTPQKNQSFGLRAFTLAMAADTPPHNNAAINRPNIVIASSTCFYLQLVFFCTLTVVLTRPHVSLYIFRAFR